jgi:TP901-1 family phage major tail protein
MPTPRRGQLMVLKAGDGEASEEFTTVAMQRVTGLAINGEVIDITNKDSEGFRQLLDGGNVRSLTITAEGIFGDDASQLLMESRCLDGSINNYQVVFDGGRTYEMGGVVTSVEYTGNHDDVHTYSTTIESSDEPTITPTPPPD